MPLLQPQGYWKKHDQKERSVKTREENHWKWKKKNIMWYYVYIYIWKHHVFKRKLDCIAFFHLFPYIVWFCSFGTRSTCALWFLLVCCFKASFSSSKRPLKRGAHLPQDKPFAFIILVVVGNMGMDQYLLIPFLGEWTSIYQLFWGSLGTRVLTHPHIDTRDNYLPLRLYFFFCHDIPGATLYFHPLCIPWNVSRIIPLCLRHLFYLLRCMDPALRGQTSMQFPKLNWTWICQKHQTTTRIVWFWLMFIGITLW